MPALQPVRGTHDLLPDDNRRHRRVVEIARDFAERYGFEEMVTPIFEFTEVFARSIGETSDIVSKEMYTFEDRGGERVTLRPEATAGIVRAFISNGLHQNLPLKYFYHGPMFRYERPQKGRLRQFHQIDVEILGVAGPQADIEVIAIGRDIIDGLGIGADVTLELNTLGDSESRRAYRGVLVDYLSQHKDKLSKDSLDRLERNPMRILDSKDEGDRRIVANAPVYSDYLNDASRRFFLAVRDGLDRLGIKYTINPRLVRGLDYYCHTCFEFTTTALGAQGTVLGGGRYDGLIKLMGGPETAGIGWAAGIERLAMMLSEAPRAMRPIALVPIGEAADVRAITLAHELRQAGYRVEHGYGGNTGKRMKRANKLNARAAVLIGDDELQRNAATVRDLDTGEQTDVPLSELTGRLARFK
ncbi:MAG: histidine--tRNA ligase [Alphaproteobacteria bacterium]|nr:histidine--tRNA ligase [Alphaproteobacteria bacterium]